MPLSGTMNPNPLETSNHLITPEISMTDAAALPIRLSSEPASNTKLVPGPLGLITFVVMRTHAAAVFGASFGRFAGAFTRAGNPWPSRPAFRTGPLPAGRD